LYESYYQEAGRGGRDDKKAYAVMLFHQSELDDLEKQSDLRFPPFEEVKKVYKALVNYLQLPSGSGEGMYFEFDINDFVKKFKLNTYTVIFSLKIMEQEEFISYNEQVFLPSTVVFCCDKDHLQEFEKTYPNLEVVIKGLLRSYEGIFDHPSVIHENQLAVFINKDVMDVKTNLKKLQQYGIIEYHPQKDKPQIQFLRNRINAADFSINQDNLLKRKNAYEKRVKAMIRYVNIHACRSKTIGNYFDDLSIKPCGICDNCIKDKVLIISKTEFENIHMNIEELIQKAPVASNLLLKNLGAFKKDKVWKVINYLLSENKLNITEDGLISKKA
jgi:ATP-dependent DNA helicase RecQ